MLVRATKASGATGEAAKAVAAVLHPHIVKEEQFGPVLPVLSYKTVDEAVERANDTRMGLCASVWTSDAERGAEVASRIEAGTVWINHHVGSHPDIPFGGFKESGLGREHARQAQKRVLGGGVGAEIGRAVHRGEARDVDDAAPARRDHAGESGLGTEQGADQVDLHDGAHLLGRDLEERRGLGDA